MKLKKLLKKMIIGIIGFVVILALGGFLFMQHPMFGANPKGERLERIKQSPNYSDGEFKNQSPTQMMVSNKSKPMALLGFLFRSVEDLRPSAKIPSVKTDLKNLNADKNVLVWLGHSSLYIQLDGKKIAFDPVLVSASPVPFVNNAFAGANDYNPDDLPDLDYLIITHDHWDHLDYKTMLNLKNRTQKVICPLGVGAHFERWGFDASKITELDWNDAVQLENLKITALPARHFSGRGLSSNHSLWVGYMLQSASLGNIFVSGDTGYDTHFRKIKEQFGTIDFAILENGQYNEQWKYIHIVPEDLITAIKDLQPKKLITVHNSKFALGMHPWYEPMEVISQASEEHSFDLITPMIGETVMLNDSTQVFEKWWEEK